SGRFNNITTYLSALSEGFQLVKNKSITMETARNGVRLKLNHLDSVEYPMGAVFTCLAALTSTMMGHRERHVSGMTYLTCKTCGYQGNRLLQISEYFQLYNTGPFQDGIYERGYISDCLGWHLSDQQKISRIPCPECSSTTYHHPLLLDVSMNRLPYSMCIMLNKDCFLLNERLIYSHNSLDVVYNLRGVIYGDGSHFVARLITRDGNIWFHDGMTTQSSCIFEGKLGQLLDSNWLTISSKVYNHRKAVLAIYAQT
ncbi:MAG TPA: hypothetical protein VEP90_29625, partial [Methylomirabilota bacterium]|nr:hypothetical protein [Methylomirabilota bacterium]